MTLSDARKIVAAYLAGARVVDPDVEAARTTLARTVRSESLRLDLGTAAQPSDCDIFLAHLAEFCEMSRDRRALEAADLQHHLDTCPSCRVPFWEVESPWIEAKPRLEGTRDVHRPRRITARIHVAFNAAGDLVERGSGPPAQFTRAIAATADADGGQAGEVGKRWTLADVDAGHTVVVTVEPSPAATALVSVDLESARPDITVARIELRRGDDGAAVVSGPLDDVLVEPLRVGPGDWTLLLSTTRPAMCTWEIPLRLEPARSAEDDDE